MSTVAIVGGNGQVARQIITRLVAAGDQPVALVRKPEYRDDLERLGARVELVDIEQQDAPAFAAAFGDADAVVFSAGGGPDGNIERKRSVDLGGSLKSIDGAREAGIRRFVQISAIGVDQPPGDDASEVWRAYVQAKRDADTAVRDSDLDWTILRPGGLTDDPGTGSVALAETLERGQVPRADVAAVVVACLHDDRTIGRQWELVSGDQAVETAIDTAVGS